MLLSSHTEHLIEAGVDEAGRGSLAGPVVAAAVILPKGYTHPLLNDSKQLSARQREQLKHEIKKNAIAYSIAEVSNKIIDEINILNATFMAMHIAIDTLNLTPELLLIDGNRFKKYKNVSHICVVNGDATYMSIAAASILAKTYRDELMITLSEQYPQYGWEKNMAYATKEHKQAILKYGHSPLHRKSFQLKEMQLRLFEE
ncbi:MAG: ribonuclease HII [Cytophagaceae bacterium]|nr:ribonuclease HII [Cytophagaceae bacterium]MDW8456970.1 ribonuclease HII [Cytophagaceae bacterium]